MEAVDTGFANHNEPWEENVEAFRRELTAFANELPDSHYSDWLLRIINDEGSQLMSKVKEFAEELSDSHYREWLLLIASEYNDEGPDGGVVREADNTDAEYELFVEADADGDMYVVLSGSGHQVAQMDADVWEELMNQYRRITSQNRY